MADKIFPILQKLGAVIKNEAGHIIGIWTCIWTSIEKKNLNLSNDTVGVQTFYFYFYRVPTVGPVFKLYSNLT